MRTLSSLPSKIYRHRVAPTLSRERFGDAGATIEIWPPAQPKNLAVRSHKHPQHTDCLLLLLLLLLLGMLPPLLLPLWFLMPGWNHFVVNEIRLVSRSDPPAGLGHCSFSCPGAWPLALWDSVLM
jgi:hypothetical protein